MLRTLGILALAWSCHTLSGGGEPSAPNIVLIMADDMGWSDLGCYGGEIATPNIDSLARDGMLFTQFHNNAKCTTTRASVLTGSERLMPGKISWQKVPSLRAVLTRRLK